MDERLITGVSGTLSATFYVDDVATYADAVTVRVTRDGDGAYLTSGTGFATATSGAASGSYSITIDPQSSLGPITATWHVTRSGVTSTVVTYAEIVGSRLVSVADVRSSDTTLADSSKYPLATVRQAIRDVEDEFERILGAATIRRGAIEVAYGTGPQLFVSKRPTYSVTSIYTGTDVTAVTGATAQWDGTITRTDGLNFDTVSTVWYTYGLTAVPNDLRRAALLRIRHRLNADRSGIPDRATQMVIADGGQFTLATPGKGGSFTGIPDVDAVLARYSMRAPGVG